MNGSAREVQVAGDDAQKPLVALHLIHTAAYGGVETILINWIDAMQKRSGMRVHLVCFEDPNGVQRPFVEAVERAGLEIRFIPWHRGKPVWRSGRALEAIIRETGTQIVHTHNTYAELVGLLAARRTGARLLTTLYVWGDFGWKRNLLQKIDQWILRHYDLVTAQCETTRLDTVHRGIDSARTRVLPSGFPLAGPLPAPEQRLLDRRAAGIDDEHILLANVARFYPEKAQDQLLRCFQRIHAEVPQTRLRLYGTGPLEPQLRALCSALDLDEVVEFPGFAPEIARELRLMDILVHPSHAEGVPLAICSGMEAGLPVVASAVGGIPEVLKEGLTGHLVPAAGSEGFEDAFVSAVLDLVRDSKQRHRIGRGARAFIENDYSLDRAMDLLEQSYRELLAEPGR